MKIAIIDYGMGNLFSVEQAVLRLGCDVVVSANAEELLAADALILPGVGAFADSIKCLEESSLKAVVEKAVELEKPLLGICLGMQLLFESSEENGQHKGLGIFKGHIKRFDDSKARVPHMGWNDLNFENVPEWLNPAQLTDAYVYFVHSYFASDLDENELVAYADYAGERVPGIVKKGSVTGMQFHPEKSGSCGMALLEGWLNEVKQEVTVK